MMNVSCLSVHNVTVHQLQQHTIEVCCEMIKLNELVKQIIPYCWQNTLSAQHDVGQLWCVTFIAFQHSIPRVIIDWHIHMVHLLLFFTSELQLSYLFTFKNVLLSSIVVIFKSKQILLRNLPRMWLEPSSVKAVNLVKKSVTVTEKINLS